MDYIDNQNDFIRNFLGITAWHKAGYTGKGIVIGSAENFLATDSSANTAHAHATYAACKEFAPDAEFIWLPPWGYTDETFMAEQIAVIKEKKISVWFASLMLPFDSGIDKALSGVSEYCTFINAIGNFDTDVYSQFSRSAYVIGVGAYSLVDGVPIPEGFSSVSEFIDCSAPDGYYIFGSPAHGTSFSAPALASAICALVNQYFIEKTGKPLSNAMMLQFIKDHSHDFYTEGFDTKTGWGYVKLPDPETIDIGRYAPLEITMQIGSNKMTVNGETKVLDQAPIIAPTGRTLAPVRAVFEAAGLTVEWDAVTKTITATR